LFRRILREQTAWNLTGILSGFAGAGLRKTGDRKMAARFRESVGQGVCSICLDDGGRKLIAEFSASNDVFSMVKAEFIAMRLAQMAGMNVAPVALLRGMEKDAPIVERFDRVAQQGSMFTRRAKSRRAARTCRQITVLARRSCFARNGTRCWPQSERRRGRSMTPARCPKPTKWRLSTR
jgi:hypothetical protein